MDVYPVSYTHLMLQVPQALIQIIFGLTRNKTVILIILNLFLFVVGMIVNDSTGMLLCAPLLLPLVKELGVSPVHFAAIMGVNLAMGGVTPVSYTHLVIPLMISERLIDVNADYRGACIRAAGQFRSYNRHEEKKNRLVLSVFVRELEFMDEEVENSKTNQIFLDGYICKAPRCV